LFRSLRGAERALGEADEVCDGQRSLLEEQLTRDHAARCRDLSVEAVGQWWRVSGGEPQGAGKGNTGETERFHALWVRYLEACFDLVGGMGWSVDCTRVGKFAVVWANVPGLARKGACSSRPCGFMHRHIGFLVQFGRTLAGEQLPPDPRVGRDPDRHEQEKPSGHGGIDAVVEDLRTQWTTRFF